MTTEPEDEITDWTPEHVQEGEVLIHDPDEFFELTNALAAKMQDGELLVLLRGSLKWENVETLGKARANVSAIK